MSSASKNAVGTLQALRIAIEQFKTQEKFLELVAQKFGEDTDPCRLIMQAENMVSSGFDKIRRHSGEQYVEHLRGTAVIGLIWKNETDYKSVISDLHHDSVEDIEMTLAVLRQTFGRRVAATVAGQTKPPLPEQGVMKRHAYNELCSFLIFEHVKQAGIHSMRGKCRDRLHNMLTLWGSPKKKLEKIKETLQFMLPIAIHIDYLWEEISLACAEQLERLSTDDTKSDWGGVK